MMVKNVLTILLLSAPLTQQIRGKVIYIVDGDTIEILYQGGPLRVHLNGIDCPEPKQPFGPAATEAASRLCLGMSVVVNVRGKDEYGRTLGDVQLPDGRILNQEMIKIGLAWHYKLYSSDKVLSQLESGSRKDKIGLWSEKDPIPPWEYRHAITD